MSNAFDSIMRGLDEIKLHNEGKVRLASTTLTIEPPPTYDAQGVKTLRTELRLSQSAFAHVFGVSKKTVEAWESGRNTPSGVACRLIQIIEKDKAFLEREKILAYS